MEILLVTDAGIPCDCAEQKSKLFGPEVTGSTSDCSVEITRSKIA